MAPALFKFVDGYLESAIEGKEIEIQPQYWSDAITTETTGALAVKYYNICPSEAIKVMLCALNELLKLAVQRGLYTN